MSWSKPDNALDTSSIEWIRFDRYLIEEDVIQPDLDSAMTLYDPWQDYEVSRRGRAEKDPPYQALLRFISEPLFDPAIIRDLDGGIRLPLASGTFDRLIAWCEQHGLLGILPHRTRVMNLAPYALRQQYVDEETGEPVDEGVPHQTIHALIGGTWQDIYAENEARDDAVHHPEVPLPPDLIPPGWSGPSVLLESMEWGIVEQGSLRDDVWPFFPDVPEDEAETHQYPRPLSEEFWKGYGEPVWKFIRGAAAFQQAVLNVGARKIATRQEGLRNLHALAGAVRVTVEPGPKGTYRQRWASPSLLATYALMFLQDLVGGHHVRQCKACHQVYAAAAYQSKYCSARCRQRLEKRRHRERKRAREKKVVGRRSVKGTRSSRAS